MASLCVNRTVIDTAMQFLSIIDKLLSLTSTKISDKRRINACLNDLNELDYRCLGVTNNDAVLLLVNQLCANILPAETSLVQNASRFLHNLTQSDVKLHGRTFATCKRWILEALEFSEPLAQIDVLIAIKSFLHVGYFNDVNHYARLLLRDKGLLARHLNPLHSPWSEINFHALGCLEEIVISRSNGNCLSDEFVSLIKDIILKVLSNLPYQSDDKLYYGKIVHLCLHALHLMITERLIPSSPDFVGEVLGVAQAFLFHGIKGYAPARPQVLRPTAMNLPERVHAVPKCKNLKNHRARPKKTPAKKITVSSDAEHASISKCSSDSDTSDTEANNSVHVDSKVRLGAMHLTQALVEIAQSREIFGYWPQIVATGSRNDARVLTRSVLVEPVSKVRQNVLSTLTELLTGARPFLIHAEETNHTSFITFFGTVCLMIKELHCALSLVLLSEKNVAVLTHALKCTAALVQGTPYERLRPGLATKLVRNCRPHIFHKDPTVRVAALSIFEAFASSESVTQEILGILAKRSTDGVESARSQLSASSTSDAGEAEEEEEEEIDIEDVGRNSTNGCNEMKTSRDESVSLLVRVCLENISNKAVSTPVRLQSLKLMGRLTFNTGSLVFPHLERVTATLVSVMEETEGQVVLHACRVLEIMSGCLANTEVYHGDGALFWNIIFESTISLAQTSQTILREAACDCLGSISGNVFTQLSRQRTILVITILFGAVRDEESAVRAAGLRALGMLITLPALEDDTGFLMDLADVVCSASDDKNLGVRVKSAWAMANLCDCLSRQRNHEEIEPFPLEVVLPKLYHVSVKAAKDNDKVKCNAVRAVGSILYLCPQKHILSDTTLGLDALINCAVLGNDMKVRWNACRALGLVLSHNPDVILPSSWKDQVFPAFSTLICNSPNFKVRTNAAWALSSCNHYGKYTVMLWKSIVLAFENAQHVPSYVEYPHRDALIQQLCLTLSRVAACTEEPELQNLWIEIGDHVEEISNFMKQFQETVLPEKFGELIKAKARLERHAKDARCAEDRQIAQSLASMFERTNRYDNLDVVTLTMQ